MGSSVGDETIRDILSKDIPTCHPEDTKGDILDQLDGEMWESADTIYVTEGGQLVGRIDIAALFGSADHIPASRLMEPVTARLLPNADRERAVFLAIKSDRTEIPVVDADGQLIGAVTSKAIIDSMHEEHLEDILLSAGIQQARLRIRDLASTRVRVAFLTRAPWLLFGLVAGLILSVVTSQFEATLEQTIALAFFAPVVAYIADSVGTQSEAIAIRAFAISDVDYGRYLLRELLAGILIGIMLGVLGGLGAAVIVGSTQIGVVVGLSLLISSIVATVLASAIPIGFILLDVDPALGSGPLATALQDIISIVIYFLFAIALL
ncbi:magnesium transporter [Halorarum salinum]|uniref:Magnesium transporter n=1 Tax=Halorarum salinum TaxID=2743089 RepID=A0A7D5LD57_9EURY|nr:magnesium transporter [Halobaculum salinum]QLG63195.1 magnesium transporter [Halobaculum salinum]